MLIALFVFCTYYYNKVTRTSKWRMPDEVKLAHEKDTISHASDFRSISVVKTSSPGADGSLVSENGAKSSPIVVSPATNLPTIMASVSSSLSDKVSSPMIETVKMKNSSKPALPAVFRFICYKFASVLCWFLFGIQFFFSSETTTIQDVVVYGDGFSSENRENVKKDAAITEIEGATPLDEKTVELGPLVYESKAAMRAVINDRRYGALKSLCERKQAFNEYLSQKKKLEAEKRRVKQKKAREHFRIMLEAISIFEHDECFKAVEQAKDREDLFEDYVEELEKKVKLLLQNFLEHTKALEEQKRNRVEYLEFLKSCDFIKVFVLVELASVPRLCFSISRRPVASGGKFRTAWKLMKDAPALRKSLGDFPDILNADDILDTSVVSCVSIDILNADDILDGSVVSGTSTDIA
ncbi:putative pre-mRNA-processing protein 40A-like isoform X2 [Capsicum annuum]|nr:putative pre-mRNA-processing protein 40A-like isoform X2 [Capsicum annuum]